MNTTKTVATYDHYTRAKSYFVPSPCVSVCTMNAVSHLCDGCFRTIDEITGWSGMDDPAKRRVWALIDQRAANSPSEFPATP